MTIKKRALRENVAWTEERISALKKMWSDGLSTAAIGRRLNVSKNAIIGKAHRLGLPSRPSPIKRRVEAIEVSEPEQHVAIQKPKAARCCWPFGDPKDKDFHFCEKNAATSKPYCDEHCAIAYVRTPKLREAV